MRRSDTGVNQSAPEAAGSAAGSLSHRSRSVSRPPHSLTAAARRILLFFPPFGRRGWARGRPRGRAAAGAAAEAHASGAPFRDGETFGKSAGNTARHQPEGKQGGSDKSGLVARSTKESAHRITRYVHEILGLG